jgi:dolichol-phosphate mannosyltransferase
MSRETDQTNSTHYELAIIMPVYNEEGCIAEVLQSWVEVLSGQNINYVIIALNDGSRDGTKAVLDKMASNPRLKVIHKTNSGHGPTILQGYRMAADMADWVFHCDSDGEMPAEHFPRLWKERDRYDALFGIRGERVQSISRKFITIISRVTVRLFFGARVQDVNTPYRLLRAPLLKAIVNQIPPLTFAPNLIISGTVSRWKMRVYECSIPHQHRRTGQVSIVKWKLWKAALRAFGETIRCRPHAPKTLTD